MKIFLIILFFDFSHSFRHNYVDERADGSSEEPSPRRIACGEKMPANRVAFEQLSPPFDWPWAVSVRTECVMKNTNQSVVFQTCSGVLIGSKDVLTAAHCLSTQVDTIVRCMKAEIIADFEDPATRVFLNPKFVKVTVGGSDWSQTKSLSIKKYTKFAHYKSNQLEDDVALLELVKPLQFDGRINRLCLPSMYHAKNGHLAYYVGYGRTFRAREIGATNQTQSLNLREDLIQVRVGYPCPRNFLCTSPQTHTTRETTHGDSGGPIMREYGGKWYLIGLVKARR